MSIGLTLQEGGVFKAPPEQNRQFKHLLVIQLSQKILLFPEPYGDASHTLLGAQNSQKSGFYSIFVVGGDNFQIIKFGF